MSLTKLMNQQNRNHFFKSIKKDISLFVAFCLVLSNLSVMSANASTGQVTYDTTTFGSINATGSSITDGIFTFTGSDSDLNNAVSVSSAGITLLANDNTPSAATAGAITIAAVSGTAITPFHSITVNSLIGTSYTFSITFDNSVDAVATVTVDDTNKDSQLNGYNVKTIVFDPSVNANAMNVNIAQVTGSAIGIDTAITEFVVDSLPAVPVAPVDPVTPPAITVTPEPVTPPAVTVTPEAINVAPVASGINFTGTPKLGNTITAAYLYTDEDQDQQGTSLFKWYRADDANGTNKAAISNATSLSYLITRADQGKYLFFEVTPVAVTGAAIGDAVSASIKVAPNVKPVISKLIFNDTTPKVGQKLTISYVYADADKDAQGATVIKWYRADNASGLNKKLISGATGLSYTTTLSDQGKYIFVQVTPKAKTGVLTGTTQSVSTKAVAKLSAHVKLGVIGSKTHANAVANYVKNNYKYATAVVKKEGVYYRVYFNFVDKTTSEKAMGIMKKKGLIKNYTYIK